METLILGAFNKLAESPGILPVIISVAVLLFGAFIFIRKTAIEENTSAGALHSQQIETLMAQVKMLSDELTLARQQLHDIHAQNMDLMKHVRVSNLRIQELELMIQGNG
jgi:hypothetical protein